MPYVVSLSTSNGEHAGYLGKGRAVPLDRATVYSSPSSAQQSQLSARERFVCEVLPLRQARDLDARRPPAGAGKVQDR